MTDPQNLATGETALISGFAGPNAQYYAAAFDRIGAGRPGLQLNLAALIFGPIWLGARAVWGAFWPAFIVGLTAVVLLMTALFGDPGSEATARAERLTAQAADRLTAAEAAIAAGNSLGEGMKRSAQGIAQAAENARAEAEAAQSASTLVAGMSAGLLVALHLLIALFGNRALYRRFQRWRGNRSLAAGLPPIRVGLTAAFVLLAYLIASIRFAAPQSPGWLATFPAPPSLANDSARSIDRWFKLASDGFGGFFRGISNAINAILGLLEVALTATPWPIVFASVIIIAWQTGGRRVAVLAGVALAYLGLFGFWEKSMATVALLGTAAFLCVAIGLPLGVWAGRNPRVMGFLRPILDLMQTMPAFVYLIPVIAFFGIGKPPGIIATIIFGMPPVVRLTALGIASVPESIREAATAFGGSERFLLFKVDLPIARESIMAGVNQTLLMCLSMVVIASLIGAKGLGEDVLSALQYAAVGKGILAGLAILACAMVIDRIVQGRRKD